MNKPESSTVAPPRSDLLDRRRHSSSLESQGCSGDSPFSQQFQADLAFTELLKGFRPSGGLWRLDEAQRFLAGRRPGAAHELERWRGQWLLCEFYWRGQAWLPGCQFDLAAGHLRGELRRAASSHGLRLDAPQLLRWLIQPLARWQGRTPAELLVKDVIAFQAAVHEADLTDGQPSWLLAA